MSKILNYILKILIWVCILQAHTFATPITSGLQVWLDIQDASTLFQEPCTSASTPASNNGDSIGCWQDKSGNENNASATGATRWTLATNSINTTQNTLLFDGVDDYYPSIANVGAEKTVFAVFQRTDSNLRGLWNYSASISSGFLPYWWSRTYFYTNNWTSITPSAFDINTYYVATGEYSTAASSLFINKNVTATITGTSSANTTGNFNLGRYNIATYTFLGNVAELIIYDRTLSSAEQDLVQDYLGCKYNINTFTCINPIVTEVTPVSSPTTNTSPAYTLNASHAWIVSFGGDCSALTPISVNIGSNTINLGSLSPGIYSNCTMTLTVSGFSSPITNISPFIINGVLSIEIVDASGNNVSNPTVNFSTVFSSIQANQTTATLGTTIEKIRIKNPRNTPTWSVNISASNTVWSDGGTNTIKYNDNANAVQLEVQPTSGNIVNITNSNISGITFWADTHFSSGVNSINIASAGSSSATYSEFDITTIWLEQDIPIVQPDGVYSLDMMLTVL